MGGHLKGLREHAWGKWVHRYSWQKDSGLDCFICKTVPGWQELLLYSTTLCKNSNKNNKKQNPMASSMTKKLHPLEPNVIFKIKNVWVAQAISDNKAWMVFKMCYRRLKESRGPPVCIRRQRNSNHQKPSPQSFVSQSGGSTWNLRSLSGSSVWVDMESPSGLE